MVAKEKYEEVLAKLGSVEDEKNKLQTDLENLRLYFSELEATNNHLIAATWRERDLKKKLAETIDELNKTKDIVENQNRRISESINYARKIQLAINPTESDLANHFPESFILYQPKDIISGDFPWLYASGEYVYVAAVDCTGHGVPGAMMSMIGNLLLNDIANEKEALLPSEILIKLHHSVVSTLKQNVSDSNSNDGMDIGLMRINKVTHEIMYSGAHRPLFLHSGNEIQVLAGDKFPIGGTHYKGLNTYTDQSITIKEGDAVYVFTDGFPDQIGGPDKRKLMPRNLKQFIETNANCSMPLLHERLNSFFHSWKGENKQIDDVLFIGIKF